MLGSSKGFTFCGNTQTHGDVAITVKIYSPEPSQCLLWTETQTVAAVNGAFALELGNADHRVSSGPGSAADGAANFRDVFLNHAGLNIASSECASGYSSYQPIANDDRLMTAVFTDVSRNVVITTENIPIKSVPFTKQAQEIGGYGPSNLLRISGGGFAHEFSPTEMQTLKDMLGRNIDWNIGNERITNVADPVAGTDVANRQWVETYVAANGGGTLTQAEVYAALGYTPISSTSSSEVQSALGFTPVNRAGDTMTGTLSLPSNGLSVGSGRLVVSGGNVGIGTTSPAQRLAVAGSIHATSTSHTVLNLETIGDSSVPHFIGSKARGTPSAPTYPQNNDVLAVFQGRDAVDWDSWPGLAILAEENFTSSAKGAGINFSTTPIGSKVPIEQVRISNSGHVGIGTSNPQAELHVLKFDNAAETPEVRIENPSNGSDAVSYASFYNDTGLSGLLYQRSSTNASEAANAFVLKNVKSAPLIFGTNNNERMRIDANGLVGIGTKTPGHAFHVLKPAASGLAIVTAGTLGNAYTDRPGWLLKAPNYDGYANLSPTQGI